MKKLKNMKIINFDKLTDEQIDCDSIAVFYKGKWAEVVKEKTTEEWLNQLDAHLSDICGDNNTYLDIFIKFFEQNNLEITQKK